MSVATDSIRGQLEAAIKHHAEPEDEVVETVDTSAETSTETTETTTQERARDERGRFAAKNGAESASDTARFAAKNGAESASDTAAESGAKDPVLEAAATKPVGAEAQSPLEQQKGTDQPSAHSLAPPNGWSAEAKAKWHELSPEVMAAVQQREKDIAKFTSTRDEHASFGKDIYQAVQPYLAQIKSEGGTPRGAIESLLNTAYVLRTGSPERKRDLLLRTAAQFGVDLGVKPGQASTTTTAPELQRLEREVAELKGLLGQREQDAQHQLQTEVQAEIAAFAADPKNVHYEAVKGHMSALIAHGLAKDLQDAYDQAVNARPDTRATLEAQRRAEEEQKRRIAAKRRADEAKRKAVSITGGPGNAAAESAPGGRSIREELLAASAAQSGAV